MRERIFNTSFKQFLKTPFSLFFFALLLALFWAGKLLLKSKDNEILKQHEKLKDCDEERKKDKQLLQDLVFEKKRAEKLKN